MLEKLRFGRLGHAIIPGTHPAAAEHHRGLAFLPSALLISVWRHSTPSRPNHYSSHPPTVWPTSLTSRMKPVSVSCSACSLCSQRSSFLPPTCPNSHRMMLSCSATSLMSALEGSLICYCPSQIAFLIRNVQGTGQDRH